MSECEYLEQRDVTNRGSDVWDHSDYKFYCWHDGTPKEICQWTCKQCKELHALKYNATPMPSIAPAKPECPYCSTNYHQGIICISKRYHTSSEFTSQIIPTNFCPVCGRKI